MSVEDLLYHVRKEAGYDDDNDGEPRRAAGQQLHEHKVHVLGVEERPGGRGRDTAVTVLQEKGKRSALESWLV